MAEKPSDDKIAVPSGVKEQPAIYCDYYFVSTWPDHVRITFGELFGDDFVSYRSAVLMTIDDAEGMIDLLRELIDKEKARPKK